MKPTWSALFDTKTGNKLHKHQRAKSAPENNAFGMFPIGEDFPVLTRFGIPRVRDDFVHHNTRTINGTIPSPFTTTPFDTATPLHGANYTNHPNDDAATIVSEAETVIVRPELRQYEDEEFDEFEDDIYEATTISITSTKPATVQRTREVSTTSTSRTTGKQPPTARPEHDIFKYHPSTVDENEHFPSDSTMPMDNETEPSSEIDHSSLSGDSPNQGTQDLNKSDLIQPGRPQLRRKRRFASVTSQDNGENWHLPKKMRFPSIATPQEKPKHGKITESIRKTYTAVRGSDRRNGNLPTWADYIRKRLGKSERPAQHVDNADQ